VSRSAAGGSAADDERLALAAAVRAACCRVAARAWEQARQSGLCDEGAWEVALGALRATAPAELLREAEGDAAAGHEP
jgi:hypothetical protein